VANQGRARRAAVILLSGLVVEVAAGCGSLGDDVERSADGAVVAPGEVESLDLLVGDCFDNPGDDRVTTVHVVPCGDPHDYEVFHIFELEDDGEYPGDVVVQQQWTAGCLQEFEDFVGMPFDVSEIEISGIYPTAETWRSIEDREVICSVTRLDGQSLVGSARDIGI
jgi:hypothetical protein